MQDCAYTPGRYLHSWWVDKFGIAGEGFAPLSAPGHQFITKAALDVLPEVREWLGGEGELLTWTYCGFPDMNWHVYGRWQPACEYLPEQRYPDTRREWEISRYCDYNDLTKAGEWFGHHYPSAGQGAGKNYRRAWAAARQRRGWDAVRLLGAVLHFLQDSGSPPHAMRRRHAPRERVAHPRTGITPLAPRRGPDHRARGRGPAPCRHRRAGHRRRGPVHIPESRAGVSDRLRTDPQT